MVQLLALVVVDVFGRAMDSYYQALLMLAILICTGMVNMACSPNRAHVLAVMQFLSLTVLSLTLVLGLVNEGEGAARAALAQAAGSSEVRLKPSLGGACGCGGFIPTL